jgi:superfamily II DNA or RNA helicase/HKD family nuclease
MPQDPLAPGLRDELITEDLAYLLQAATDQAESRPLEPSEALERLGKHLLRVARRLRAPSDKEKLVETIALVNAAIEALGEDLRGDQLEPPARVLQGVRPTSGLAQDSLPDHPMIPLTSSELLVNGVNEPSFGTVLREELRCATDVDLICAFIGFTGFEPLKNEFRALVERGGRVRVITSTYLGSTSAKALHELVKLGADVRVNYQGHATKLHAKAWLFRRPGELDTAFVGSSNLSEAALYSGLEWNVRLARADAPGVFTRIQNTFDSYWHTAAYEPYTLEDRERLEAALFDARGYAVDAFSKQAQRTIDQYKHQLAEVYEQLHLLAKPHQQRVLDTLALRREVFDEHRHLVVAATGTGKTVMAALDYVQLCRAGERRPRLLFVAHREQILMQALATFRNALRDPNFGEVLSGAAGAPANDAHVFAMVQTLHNRLEHVPSDSYDVIYIDEAHHVAASSWREVIEHFRPREIVGLTATPERTDGVAIAQLFGGEYTTELRLWEAVDDQLLVPFQYVGVDDGTDLRSLAWHRGDYAIGSLSALYTGDHQRVRRTVDALNRWVESPANIRALGFCVTVDHAIFMAEQFTQIGLEADYLSGEHDAAHRDAVLSKLSAGELQVVFSVDVLGEGVDVPDVDTLLLLRPTQSPVLFAQQLGRGLRTSPGKSSCLVVDLIGQHRTEYRLEERFKALVDPSRGTVREQLSLDFPFLPAGCSINLEQVAKERVIAALQAVAARPGIKSLTKDLVALESISLERFLTETGRSIEQFYGTEQRTLSWTRLRRLAENSAAPPQPATAELTQEEAALLRRIGYLQHVTDPQRADAWFDWLTSPTPPDSSTFTLLQRRLAIQLMHGLNLTPPTLEEGFEVLWRHRAVRDEIAELLALTRPMIDASPTPLLGLGDVPVMVHARYTRAEVLAATGVSHIDQRFTQQSGVHFEPSSRSQLMFVTLHKDNSRFTSTTQYKDHAITRDLFHWESPNNWRQQGTAMQRCIGAGPDGSQPRLLFVRERSSGATEGTFRCFGQVDLDGELEGNRPVALTWRLRQPLPEVAFEAATLILAS